jgi:hypothetical protein
MPCVSNLPSTGSSTFFFHFCLSLTTIIPRLRIWKFELVGKSWEILWRHKIINLRAQVEADIKSGTLDYNGILLLSLIKTLGYVRYKKLGCGCGWFSLKQSKSFHMPLPRFGSGNGVERQWFSKWEGTNCAPKAKGIQCHEQPYHLIRLGSQPIFDFESKQTGLWVGSVRDGARQYEQWEILWAKNAVVDLA